MVIAPARRAGDPGSIPGPGENFSLKLLICIIFDEDRIFSDHSGKTLRIKIIVAPTPRTN